MTLTLYNTLTRRKEPFEPIEPGKVKMYCCGVTVYNYSHLGHARTYVVWDTMRRYLRWRGYEVRYVQNFTDIDDKILNRAREEGSTMQEVADRYTQAYFEDMRRLNILEADEYPRATHTLNGIKRLIHELEQKGFAYAAEGDVYYSVRNFAEYGKLSGRRLEDMQAGASGRVEADPDAQKKKDPFDFALWKAAKPGEPAWESDWGSGRPGWHIECSAMVRECFADAGGKELGETIDIHMGGADLIFPHHENEIAQSEAATGHPLARYWLHNGMLNVSGEKMSKSLGNFTTVRALLDSPNAPDPMAVRLFLLQAQYRKPLDFTEEGLTSATNAWETLTEGLLFGFKHGESVGWTDTQDSAFGDPAAMRIPDSEAVKQFQAAMDDDLNTAGAMAVIFDLAKELQKESNRLVHDGKALSDAQTLREQWQTLVCLAQILGLEAKPVEETIAIDPAQIESLIEQRQAAKKSKNFAEADRIRDELKAQGIALVDKPGGVVEWHKI
ncbi:cysteine--tRNA ligase [Leptolyngbya sp. FACHB-711]|uniref:cysteine--tRNA ligase n=1 Tax=unclassified Leptolyngbya TaxID=2650499 RepID=UPI001685C1F8|nr:cysteine--tRNA ligase [Leptolyngbya sp. FACHB-711]MBD1851044.1 cysteine--tRNA ligase [Cyanobacteria bacterium FACHB-502]MBD2026877.1 cysteine--tRNA ligase [Leptolyngbya sp. FACHB-711]